MASTRLDQRLLEKLARSVGKPRKYVREQISKRAARRGLTSEAAQILWANRLGIGTAAFLHRLPAYVQEQVRAELPTLLPGGPANKSAGRRKTRARPAGRENSIRYAIDYLLRDEDLKRRCARLLRGRGPFDTAIREATTVLDDRLKALGEIKDKMRPLDLVGMVLNPKPDRAILKVGTDADEQEGIYSVCKGLFLAFRNPAHHRLTDKVSRENALKFCGFVDIILDLLAQAKKS